MISLPPRTIHRIWLDDPIPDKFIEFGNRWRELNPGWLLHDWTDPCSLPLLRNQALFFRADHVYPSDWKRFQADLLRLELLWLYGGVYADMDIEPHKPLSDFIPQYSEVLVGRSPQHIGGHHPITNAFMFSRRFGHPYIRQLILDLPAALTEYKDRTLAQSIGPWHLTRIYEDDGPWRGVTVDNHLYTSGYFTHYWNTAARRRGEGLG